MSHYQSFDKFYTWWYRISDGSILGDLPFYELFALSRYAIITQHVPARVLAIGEQRKPDFVIPPQRHGATRKRLGKPLGYSVRTGGFVMAIGDRTRRSRVYKEALGRAKNFMDDPGKLDGLLGKAQAKAEHKQHALRKIWHQVGLMLDLIKYYRLGEYRDVSAKSMLLVIAALLYFVMPADLIPDILFGFGYIDDIALFGWTINSLADELRKFEAWLALHRSPVGAPKQPREARRNYASRRFLKNT